MAIYHLSMQAIGRAAGRSATAAAAYRAGCCITDRRTGEVFDYRRKQGVVSADIVLPQGVMMSLRDELWNGVEMHHKRGDAVVAREYEVALPAELSIEERRRLALDFAAEIVEQYRVVADVCIHQPSRDGDERNHHAHILLSACSIGPTGFGKKVAELDPIHCKRHKIANPAEQWRGRWAELVNERLKNSGLNERVDHRTLPEQGVERAPTFHMGPAVSAMERRGINTKVWRLLSDHLLHARELREKLKQTLKQITDVSATLAADMKARNTQLWQKLISARNDADRQQVNSQAASQDQALDQSPIAEFERAFAGRAGRPRVQAVNNAGKEPTGVTPTTPSKPDSTPELPRHDTDFDL